MDKMYVFANSEFVDFRTGKFLASDIYEVPAVFVTDGFSQKWSAERYLKDNISDSLHVHYVANSAREMRDYLQERMKQCAESWMSSDHKYTSVAEYQKAIDSLTSKINAEQAKSDVLHFVADVANNASPKTRGWIAAAGILGFFALCILAANSK